MQHFLPNSRSAPYRVGRLAVLGLAAFTLLSASSARARADVVQLNVVSSGMNVNASGVDQNYRLTQSADPNNTGPNVFAVQQLAPGWLANQTNARWIAPRRDESYAPGQAIGNQSVGQYVYETHFTVPANATLSTAMLTGQLAVDNQLNDVSLNGQSEHIQTPLRGMRPENLGYSVMFYPFTISSGFQIGDNILRFFVSNLFDTDGPNPTGVIIQISGTVNTLTTVPEPGTLTLAGMGLFGLIGFGWRRRRLSA